MSNGTFQFTHYSLDNFGRLTTTIRYISKYSFHKKALHYVKVLQTDNVLAIDCEHNTRTKRLIQNLYNMDNFKKNYSFYKKSKTEILFITRKYCVSEEMLTAILRGEEWQIAQRK